MLKRFNPVQDHHCRRTNIVGPDPFGPNYLQSLSADDRVTASKNQVNGFAG